MKQDIVRFLKKVCPELKLSANYVVAKNMYVIHKRGFGIQNFTPEQYYTIPPTGRRKLLIGILKRGLTHNIGEQGTKDKIFINSQVGIRIV